MIHTSDRRIIYMTGSSIKYVSRWKYKELVEDEEEGKEIQVIKKKHWVRANLKGVVAVKKECLVEEGKWRLGTVG